MRSGWRINVVAVYSEYLSRQSTSRDFPPLTTRVRICCAFEYEVICPMNAVTPGWPQEGHSGPSFFFLSPLSRSLSNPLVNLPTCNGLGGLSIFIGFHQTSRSMIIYYVYRHCGCQLKYWCMMVLLCGIFFRACRPFFQIFPIHLPLTDAFILLLSLAQR